MPLHYNCKGPTTRANYENQGTEVLQLIPCTVAFHFFVTSVKSKWHLVCLIPLKAENYTVQIAIKVFGSQTIFISYPQEGAPFSWSQRSDPHQSQEQGSRNVWLGQQARLHTTAYGTGIDSQVQHSHQSAAGGDCITWIYRSPASQCLQNTATTNRNLQNYSIFTGNSMVIGLKTLTKALGMAYNSLND